MSSPRAVQLRRLLAGLLTAGALALTMGLAGANAVNTDARGPAVVAEHAAHAVVGAVGHVSVVAVHVRPVLDLSVPTVALVLITLCALVILISTATGERRRARAGFTSRAPPCAAR